VKLKKSNTRIIAIIALSLSIISFSLPREYFDPHIGIDTDIFCKAYFSICSGLMDKEEIASNHYVSISLILQEVLSLCSAYVIDNSSIRAPPIITS
jgi:ABC-type antimicrobial peptide transport system permease subunit